MNGSENGEKGFVGGVGAGDGEGLGVGVGVGEPDDFGGHLNRDFSFGVIFRHFLCSPRFCKLFLHRFGASYSPFPVLPDPFTGLRACKRRSHRPLRGHCLRACPVPHAILFAFLSS